MEEMVEALIPNEGAAANDQNNNKNMPHCRICGQKSSGKHYDVFTCDGCRCFFKRAVRGNLIFRCKENGDCQVDVASRNKCKSCRLKKCYDMHMNRDIVQNPLMKPLPPQMSLQSDMVYWTNQNIPFMECEQLPFTPQQACDYDDSFNEIPSLMSQNCSSCAISNDDVSQGLTTTNKQLQAIVMDTFNATPCGKMKDIVKTDNNSEPTLSDLYSDNQLLHQIHQTALRILHMALSWAQSTQTFHQLPFVDQMSILKESGSEIFILFIILRGGITGNLQMMLVMNDSQQRENDQKTSSNVNDLKSLQKIAQRFNKMNINTTEFTCLKATVMFNPDIRGLQCVDYVEQIQNNVQSMLAKYIRTVYPNNSVRFGKLLLLLPSLRSINAKTIHNLFFKGLNEYPLNKMIDDMLTTPHLNN